MIGAEAHLVALACSDPPEGHDRWTLRLLADKAVELGLASSLTHETVRLRLKKRPQALAKAPVAHLPDEREFVAAMEDVLDLYAEPYDPNRRWCALTRPPPNCWLRCSGLR